VTHLPRFTIRVDIDDLMALNGVPVSECVRAPDVMTPASVRAAVTELAQQVRKYGAPLLDDQWGDLPERVDAWTWSGAFRRWRDG
jgi:hypothetical protein